MEKDPDKIIKFLKDQGEHVFKVIKETVYAIPPTAVSHYRYYKDWLKFANEHPKEVFVSYYYVFETIKEIEEI